MQVRAKLAVVGAIVAPALAGCATSSSDAKDDPVVHGASAPTTATAAGAHGSKLRLTSSDYGRILADGRDRALYLFTADHGKASNCAADCATAWPPYVVKSKPTAVSGAKPGLVGTTHRSDGRLQATYAGHPVYYYEGDKRPGQVLCQAVNEFGGYWYVVRANGKAVH
jgi:predicted lipoprotein with Yx(FWY)xxD motif